MQNPGISMFVDLNFQIHYVCQFGQKVIVTGDIPELGSWNPKTSLNLQWSEGNFWIGKITLNQQKYQQIQYKYCMVDEKNPSLVTMRWQDGKNRQIQNFSDQTKLCDNWNMRRVIFRLIQNPTNQSDDSSQYAGDVMITGNCEELGNHENFYKMKRFLMKTENNQKKIVYEKIINVPIGIKSIKYNYLTCNLQNEECEFQRQSRVLLLNDKNLSKRSPNTYFTTDTGFSIDFDYNHITENLLIGPYPQNIKDVKKLANDGIQCILNVQTHEDMIRQGINIDSMRNYYNQFGIQFFHYPIVDMDFFDMCLKITDASSLVDSLLRLHKKIYIHCTAGIYRSPQIALGYLIQYRNLQLDKAIETLEKGGRQIKISQEYLENLFTSQVYHPHFTNSHL